MNTVIPDSLAKQLAEADAQSAIIKELQKNKADRRNSQQPIEQDRRKGDRRGKR